MRATALRLLHVFFCVVFRSPPNSLSMTNVNGVLLPVRERAPFVLLLVCAAI